MKIQISDKHVLVELRELFDYVIGGDWGKDPDYSDPNFGYAYCIRGAEFKNWAVNKGSTASLRKVKLNNISSRKLQEGDILVEISGGGPEQPVGRTVHIERPTLALNPEIPKICTNFLRLCRPSRHLNSKFLNFYLVFFYKSGEIIRYQGGSNNLRNLKFEDYSSIFIPLPPLPEQHRIVAKIEALFTSLDRGIASLKTAQQQLKIYRQAVLKWAFEGKLTNGRVKDGELPEGWKWVKIEDIAHSLDHKRKPVNKNERQKRQGNIPYYGANGRTGWIDDFLFDEPLILVVEDETFVGRQAPFSYKIKGKSWVNNHAHILKPKQLIDIDFLNYQLSYYPFLPLTTGTTGRKKLTKNALMNAKIKICNPEEQHDIVAAIESRLSVCDKLEETIMQSLQQAEALRQSILKKAFAGQLVPQDPNDEPASVLLERIRAERLKATTGKIVKNKKSDK